MMESLKVIGILLEKYKNDDKKDIQHPDNVANDNFRFWFKNIKLKRLSETDIEVFIPADMYIYGSSEEGNPYYKILMIWINRIKDTWIEVNTDMKYIKCNQEHPF